MQGDEPEEERKDLGLARVAQVEDNVILSGEVLNLSSGGRDGEGHVVNLEMEERALRMTFQGAQSLAGYEFMSMYNFLELLYPNTFYIKSQLEINIFGVKKVLKFFQS